MGRLSGLRQKEGVKELERLVLASELLKHSISNQVEATVIGNPPVFLLQAGAQETAIFYLVIKPSKSAWQKKAAIPKFVGVRRYTVQESYKDMLALRPLANKRVCVAF